MPERGRNREACPGGRAREGHRTGSTGMATAARLRALEERHAMLEREIAEEDARPRPDELELQRLKREKLRVKEEIERLRRNG